MVYQILVKARAISPLELQKRKLNENEKVTSLVTLSTFQLVATLTGQGVFLSSPKILSEQADKIIKVLLSHSFLDDFSF